MDILVNAPTWELEWRCRDVPRRTRRKGMTKWRWANNKRRQAYTVDMLYSAHILVAHEGL